MKTAQKLLCHPEAKGRRIPLSVNFPSGSFAEPALSATNVLRMTLVVFCALTTCYLLLTTGVNAQSQLSRSFTISPPSIKIALNPGSKTEKIIKITNHTDQPLVFSSNVIDFIVTDKSGTPELLPPDSKVDNKYAASTWATVLPDSFIVPAGKAVSTTVYIQVPGDAHPGGRYFSVAFKPSGTDFAGTGAAVNTVAASLVYLTVNGPTKESARVTSFVAPNFSEFGPINFTTEIKNLGDIHANPKGVIEVKDMFGKKVFGTALESNVNIFPGTSRIYKSKLDTKWLFGKFNASFSGYYGATNNLPLTATLSFWVIPYKLIVLVLAAIVLTIILVVTMKKRHANEEVVEEIKEN